MTTRFQVGDYVLRMEADFSSGILVHGGIYQIAGVINDPRTIKLIGFGGVGMSIGLN